MKENAARLRWCLRFSPRLDARGWPDGARVWELGDFLRLQRLAAAESHSLPSVRAKACILIWLDGGPSHLETFDPKPDAPAEVRGPMSTISTTLPGIRISECLPRTAAMLDRIAIIRSMTSPLGEHNFGTHYLMTGYKPTPVLEYPTYGAVLSEVRQSAGVLPPYVAVPSFRWVDPKSRVAVICRPGIDPSRSVAIRANQTSKSAISISIKAWT